MEMGPAIYYIQKYLGDSLYNSVLGSSDPVRYGSPELYAEEYFNKMHEVDGTIIGNPNA